MSESNGPSREIQEHLGRQDQAIERLTTAIVGNGANGLMARVAGIEARQEAHDKRADEQQKDRSRTMRTIITLLLTQIVTGGVAAAIWLIREMAKP